MRSRRGREPEKPMNRQTHIRWEELYRNAAIETNTDLLRIRIDQAREAIHGRLHQVPPGSLSSERQEMEKALHALHVLWIERCQFTGGKNA